MVDTGRHKINCWVPKSLWEKVEALGYESPTKATIAGYEALTIKGESQGAHEDTGTNWEYLEGNWEKMGNQLEEAQRQIKSLDEKLKIAPDPVEFAQLRTRYEEKDKQIEEKNRYIETLKKELDKAEQDKEDLKTIYNNYFLQIQTLINQKAIEAPGNKKLWWKFW